MPFPNTPYPGYSWRLNHHMGVVNSEHLYHILWAAHKFSHETDPALRINEYLIANGQLTSNVREDSGQPDAWRDYQQILSELGLMYSLKVVSQITLTPLGLALLDGSLGFSEVIALQALRFQYPNGHHLTISSHLRSELSGTAFITVRTLAELQQLSGVRLRPGALIWRVLRRLENLGSSPQVSVDEIVCYLMRCVTNNDYEVCADAIASSRNAGSILTSLGETQRRNAQDWIKFLKLTPIFSATDGRQPVLTISDFAAAHSTEIDDMCTALETVASYWQPGAITAEDRLKWYSMFGGVDLSIPELPKMETQNIRQEFVGGKEQADAPRRFDEGLASGAIALRTFQAGLLPEISSSNITIQSIYRADLTTTAHRLHDQMVLLIAQTCKARGAEIFEDPGSVDLLVQYQQCEFIIEVKSVTPKNFISRLRYALGQVLHYDYLRAPDTQLPRRKVIAFAAHIPENSWSIDFLNNHLDMDLLTLQSGSLRIFSPSQQSIRLFG